MMRGDLISKLYLKKMFHGNRKQFDGFDFIDKVNELTKNLYRVNYKWFTYHVYKLYSDNREHYLTWACSAGDVLLFIRDDLKKEIFNKESD